MDTVILFVIPLAIVIATIIIATIANKLMLAAINRATEHMKNDPTNYKFLRHVILAVIYVVGIGLAVASIPSLRTLASSLLAGAGILAVSVGFASQHALSNIVSGMFIVIFKPFRINDRLALRTYQGIVEDITLRHTVIRDFENKRIVIPNAVISDEIIVNADITEQRICKWIDVSISYESDIALAKAIIADEIKSHPLRIDHRSAEQIEAGDPEVVVRVIQLQDSGVLLRGWAWATDAANSFVLSCDLLESVKARFDREGIVIPYPHRTVHIVQAKDA